MARARARAILALFPAVRPSAEAADPWKNSPCGAAGDEQPDAVEDAGETEVEGLER